MKKGELQKQKILLAAEELFLQRGYEDTSIQDILDRLSLSKGGFYHHFESKRAVLEAICDTHVRSAVEQKSSWFSTQRVNPPEKLSQLLRLIDPVQREQAELSLILLKACGSMEDVWIGVRQKHALEHHIFPMAAELINQGNENGSFYTRYPEEISSIIWQLACSTYDQTSALILNRGKEPELLLKLIRILNASEEAIEMVLCCPYGAIRLYEIEDYASRLESIVRNLAGGQTE